MRLYAVVLALLILSGISQADIVVNGGFETGNFTGWTLVDASGFTSIDGTLPHSGSFAANLGASPDDGTLTQILPTTPGQSYILLYWLQNEGGVPNDFSASWDGTVIPASVIVNNDPGFEYRPFAFFNLPATSSSTSLEFTFEQTPAFWHLDDVEVVPTGAPEPTVPAFLCLAVLGAFLFIRISRTLIGRGRG